MSVFYETANSTYQVDGNWVRAVRGGTQLGSEWVRALAIHDDEGHLVIVLDHSSWIRTSRITSRGPQQVTS